MAATEMTHVTVNYNSTVHIVAIIMEAYWLVNMAL